jgi:hypothetical protein
MSAKKEEGKKEETEGTERNGSITYLYLQVPRGQFAGRVYRRRPPDPTPSDPLTSSSC